MSFYSVNDKKKQIRRYPNEITKFFQQNHPEKTDFTDLSFKFHKLIFETSQNQVSVLLVDIKSKIELLALLYLYNKCYSNRQLHIRILCHDFKLWHANHIQSFDCVKDKSLQETIDLVAHITPVDILGWQRFKFNDGKCVIDLFPDMNKRLLSDYPFKGRIQAHAIQFGLNFEAENISNSVAAYISDIKTPSASIFLANEHPLNKAFINEKVLNDSVQHKQNNSETNSYQNLYSLPAESNEKDKPIAIIGGGLASAHLALSLAERGKSIKIFCKDSKVAQGASGNKQGALYPLLTPGNNVLSQFFQQAFLFSRQRIEQLAQDGFKIDYDFCGVVQTGHDDRSTKRLDKILQGQNWPTEIIQEINAEQVNQIAGISIDQAGAFYPLAGWVCPFQYTQAALAKAQLLTDIDIKYDCPIKCLEQTTAGWLLHSANQVFGTFQQVVNATGSHLTDFEQTKALPASNFRGQVSHIPSRPSISKLNAVICAHGYMMPANNNMHCVGASYVRLSQDKSYQPIEQLDNLQKMQHSYPDQKWVKDIDITGHDARVGVRMVTRDHFPMSGCLPDYEKLAQMQRPVLNKRKSYVEQYWKDAQAPVIEGLYVLGALGSRGLCSGPLAAEVLASLLCNEVPPVNHELLKKLNPNRIWIRKLLKNKPI